MQIQNSISSLDTTLYSLKYNAKILLLATRFTLDGKRQTVLQSHETPWIVNACLAALSNLRRVALLFGICLVFTSLSLFAQVNLTTSNLPIILIDTDGKTTLDDPRIEANMQIIYDENNQTASINAPVNVYNGQISIEIRGSSSQLFPKKSYGLETQLSNGENNNVSLLGMPEENDWILYAPYSDKSLMRNVLAYEIARKMGRYAARTRFCELVINDEYQGIYVFMEKLKRDKNRIDIANLNPDEIEGDDLTGGYIFKIDKQTGSGGSGWNSFYPPSFNANRQIFFQYEYPESDEIVPEQATYIQDFVRDFEDHLQSENYADSLQGYRQYIDVDSFIDYMIVNEVCKNIDAFRLSTFLYKDKDSNGGKLNIGPVWDFNLSLGNADYCEGDLTTGWVLDFNQICTGDFWLIPFWWERLRQDASFNIRAYQRWQELRQTVLSKENVLAMIAEKKSLLQEAQVRNFKEWDILSEYVWPNNYVGGSYDSEIIYLQNWLTDRIDWLDNAFENRANSEATDVLGFEAVKVVPNPFNESLQWVYRAVKDDQIRIEVMDLTGRIVLDYSFICEKTGQNTFAWQQSEMLSDGLYLYRFTLNGRQVRLGRLVKR